MYGCVLGYLFLSDIQKGKKLSIIETQLTNIEKGVERTGKHTDDKIDTLSHRLDLFLKSEIEILKESVKNKA